MTGLKILVSYAWEEKSHERWVGELGAWLHRQGLAVKLDCLETRADEAACSRTLKAMDERDLTVVICTPKYKRLMEAEEFRSGGAGWLTAGHALGERVIPVLRRGRWASAAPVWLLCARYVDLRENAPGENYDKLVRTLLSGGRLAVEK